MKGYRFKLQPTPDQEETFWQFAGVCRLVYNTALDQRRWFGTRYFEQSAQLKELRAEFEWIEAVPADTANYALRDLDQAFANFFARRAGYPSPRKKGRDDSFRCRGKDSPVRRVNAKWSEVRLPKIGWVKFRDTRPVVGRVLSITVSHNALGWFAAFAAETEDRTATEASPLPSVGIDRGVAVAIALSTGEMFVKPAAIDRVERAHRRAQRSLARKHKGSARYRSQRARCASLAARGARIRNDWLHKTSSDIASRFGSAILEDLNVAGMTAHGRRKRGLNRSILSQGWSVFATMLGYKLADRGGQLIFVPAAYTSQTCSDCGVIDKESRESQSVFRCRHCGFEANADANAALNILRRSTPELRVEAQTIGPMKREPSTARAGMLTSEEAAQ